MLTILKTVILTFVWLVLPILTGCLFGLFPQREYRKRRSAYLIGSLTIWARFYGLARIALDGKWTLTKLTRVFCILLIVLTILSTGVIIYRWNIRALIRINRAGRLRHAVAGHGIESTLAHGRLPMQRYLAYAASIVLAATVLGVKAPALYDGSWAEWGAQADTPVVTGA